MTIICHRRKSNYVACHHASNSHQLDPRCGDLSVVISMTAMMTSCSNQKKAPEVQIGANAGPDGKPAPYREPVKLSSKDGVLEVRLSAHQGTVTLDTVKQPVTNFLVFGYELIKGTSSDGSTKGDNLYPAPTLRVDPGERLIVHFDNDLAGSDDRRISTTRR